MLRLSVLAVGLGLDCDSEQCELELPVCGAWCEHAAGEACHMNETLMPCKGLHCRTSCSQWARSMSEKISVTCQEFSDFAFYPRGATVCKEECLLPEIRRERYPSPTGLGLLCRPESCDAAIQARYATEAGRLEAGLGVLQCPCNWFGSDCRDDWLQVQHVRKELLGDFQVTYLHIDPVAWSNFMLSFRPGSLVRVQHLDHQGVAREQPYALAGGEDGLLEILTGPPPTGLHPVVVDVAHALRRGVGSFYVNPPISGFFNGRYTFLLDALSSVKTVAMVSSGVGLSGIKSAIHALQGRNLDLHLVHGLRNAKELPYKELLTSTRLTLVVSGGLVFACPVFRCRLQRGAARPGRRRASAAVQSQCVFRCNEASRWPRTPRRRSMRNKPWPWTSC